MANKVILTKEQAKSVENVLRRAGNKVFIIRMHDKAHEPWVNNEASLNGISTDTLIRALYIGYEVQPTFEIGDWVKSTIGVGTGKVTKVDEYNYYTDFGLVSSKRDMTIREATTEEIAEEKERRFYAGAGREVGQIKPFDIVTHKHKKGLYEVISVEGNGEEATITKDFADSEIRVAFHYLKLDTPRKHRYPVYLDRLDVRTNE